MTIPSESEWITAIDAALLAKLPMKTIMRLGRAGLLTVRKIPGTRPRYHRAEVEQLVDSWTFPRSTSPPTPRPPAPENRPIAAP
jgi:hypothetical protein